MAAVTPDPTGTREGPSDGLGGPSSLADGRYLLEARLGTGGMGIVRRAHDRLLGRDVAVKLLADNLAADPEARARFEREAQSAARITHPNVVQVYDVGEEDGRPYFVMELVDGPSLADLLVQRGTLGAAEVEAVAIDALQGLARAHAAGLLHRDLKPGNLMRAPDGTVKVTDFGVAQATELPQMTRTGLVLGTLPYLAPERLTGAPASVATDLYGLGATLLELLTGAPPDTRLDTAGQQVHGPDDLDTVPPRLTRLVQLCLAREPEARPASAEAALELLTSDQPLPPPPARRDVTQVLPAVADVPTQVVGADAAPETVVAPAVASSASPAAEPTGRPRTGPERALSLPRSTRRWLVLGALALLVVLALAGLNSASTPDGDPGEAPAQEQPADGAPAPDEPTTDPPPGDTPGETVRNLGDWILDQS